MMRPFSLDSASTAEQAVQLARQGLQEAPHAPQPGTAVQSDAAVQYLAGGTNLLDLMKLDVMRPTRVIHIKSIAGQYGDITVDGDGLRLGAMVRMAAAAEHPVILSDYPMIADSLRLAASPQLRNMASLGGNVLQRTRCPYYRDTSWHACNRRAPGTGCAARDGANRRLAVLGTSEHCIANYPGDFANALVALDAQAWILGTDGKTYSMPVEALHRLPGDAPHIETNLPPGHLITAFTVPAGPWTRRSLYLKIRDRTSYDFALASAAVALDLASDMTVIEARIALGGLATTPWRCREAEALLRGKKLDPQVAEQAAAEAFREARAEGEAFFKGELGRRTLIRALMEAAHRDVSAAPAGRATSPSPHAVAEAAPKRAPYGEGIGQRQPRVDGYAKVTGQARYPSDEPVANAAQAFLLTSAIARGRVKEIAVDEALAMTGVLDVLTHWNVGDQAQPPAPQGEGGSTTTLESDRIWHDGQIIGVVLAETYEIARDAAHRVRVVYETEVPSGRMDSPGSVAERREPGEHQDYEVGDADNAFAQAEVRIDAWYETPPQHHNPIELFTTTCAWNNGELTIWEPSQFVHGLRNNVAKQLDLPPSKVRVISRYIGGAFGSKGAATARTAWIAVAARRLGRPVKLVATRDQGFTIATFRAETRHHLQLGARPDGTLQSLRHEGWELTSRPSRYNVSGTETTARVYACDNILTRVNVVHADRNTPGFMRAPPDTPYMFALESAMDELAVALKMDPIELRRRNDARRDPANGLPYSSRHLMDCFDQGAREFGWSARNPQPGAHRDGDWLVGWGCATAAYPSNIAATSARVTLTAEGVRAEIAAHDIGTGAYTVVAQTLQHTFQLPMSSIQVRMGDTDLPPASLAAGSSHTATILHAVAAACEKVRKALCALSVETPHGPHAGADPAALRLEKGEVVAMDGSRASFGKILESSGKGALEAYAENVPPGLPEAAMHSLYSGKPPILRGHSRKDVTAYAFGAQFAEVRVHRLTGEIRAPRLVGAFAAGTIVNPLTAYSQYMGGMIWGLGCALLEKTDVDPRAARYVNDNISEYLVAVNADVTQVKVILVPEEDSAVNPMGIKGIGEIGIVGMNAAIANAVYHATGRRIRKLPIRIEDML